ncbi:hypothetical protein [Rhodococcus sp. (in: high G+C Gram-positive bacteria)]|uniref:hypothetical protein n=1 Tax=Rhodococcus sp. TaxID=1831 RepID=UPI0019DA7751|nr:hypothetical protein [Rhodococcus sp. (in: high G+C Gram-positive bacteria)]MBF0662630.1 hypothetical protein [Rhodococcus sp. (in: high G+C Gram-positive bacteria)]
MTIRGVDEWADRWKFRAPVSFADVRRSALPADGPKRSGWYLLGFSDDTYYLGESVDLRSRMGGHAAKWGNEIASVRLLPKAASKQQLRVLERTLIRELRTQKIPLRNVVHSDVTTGRDALDELFGDEMQKEWIRDPRGVNARDTTPLKNLSEQEVRYSTAARRFSDLPEAPALTALLRTFLEACVPSPRATEFQYWSVSTGTFGGSKFPRRFCISVGMMEVLVVHGVKDSPGAVQGILNVRESTLLSRVGSLHSLRRRHPGLRIEVREYVDAGGDLLCLKPRDLNAIEGLLADPDVTAAAAQLVLDLMRKHFCVYTRYHCPQLVQLVYPEYRRSADDLQEDATTQWDSSVPYVESVSIGIEPETNIDVEELGDVDLYWIVGCGPRASGRNQVDDFIAKGEWRTDPDPRYEAKVADMLPGEPIAVRTRRNTTADHLPFDRRGHRVSVMDFYLRGTITENPGDGCSVRVSWEPLLPIPREYYLYTSQDTVWALARGVHSLADDLIGFVFDDSKQDVDYVRNLPFWAERFGDR